MASSTFVELISPPFRLTTLNSSQTQLLPDSLTQTSSATIVEAYHSPSLPFPITRLPYELCQLIYTFYFASLPTQDIVCSNAHLPHHTLTSLSLASPFLASQFSPIHFYRNAKFSFACPEALKTFSKTLASGFDVDRRKGVRKVEILYGRYDQPTRDWVFLLSTNFPSLEELTFAVSREKGRFGIGHGCFGNWWGCVRDAVREGMVGRDARKEVVLRVEDGEWGVVEIIRV